MNLEDHLGDVIRKARAMSNVSLETAAKAAGLEATELGSLEDSGNPTRQPDYSALAKAVGLEPSKLETLARGWRPAEADLSRWRELRVFSTTAEGMTVNCFLVWDPASKATALFDTGWDAQAVLETISSNNLDPCHLLITHTHADHIAELSRLRTVFPKMQVRALSPRVPQEQRLRTGETFSLGNLNIAYRETPGHAADGVTYVITGWSNNAPPVAVVGDAIFSASMGRGNDSWSVARQKVREHILTLPGATLICPGHGPLTTVAEELDHNPFF